MSYINSCKTHKFSEFIVATLADHYHSESILPTRGKAVLFLSNSGISLTKLIVMKIQFTLPSIFTWCGEENLFSYVSLLPSKEKRKPFLLMLSSDSDLRTLSSFSPSPDCSFCFFFFLLFFSSFSLLELNFDATEELSEKTPIPPAPLKSLDSAEAAAAAA